jgi:hypothetical protein
LYYPSSSLALSKHPVYTHPQTTDTPTPSFSPSSSTNITPL